jgi:hypothetical protein
MGWLTVFAFVVNVCVPLVAANVIGVASVAKDDNAVVVKLP